MVEKVVKQKYLDVIYNWTQGNSGKSLNENMSPKQGYHLAKKRVMARQWWHYMDTQYSNTEYPTNLWMWFAQTKMEYAQSLQIWTKAWPSLSCVSRKCPPNWCQMLIYHHLLNREMGKHRDNHPGNVLLNLVNGCENPRVGGSENSQMRGSLVMAFTRGCPMTITTLRYASLERELTQQSKHYIMSPSFQMRVREMQDGWMDYCCWSTSWWHVNGTGIQLTGLMMTQGMK